MVIPELPKGQAIYVVEKFEPAQCPEPGCGNEFKEEGSYAPVPLVYKPQEAREIFKAHLSSNQFFVELIVCANCKKVIPLTHLERRAYEHRDDAIRACREEEFVNLHEAQAFDSMQVQGVQRFISKGLQMSLAAIRKDLQTLEVT